MYKRCSKGKHLPFLEVQEHLLLLLKATNFIYMSKNRPRHFFLGSLHSRRPVCAKRQRNMSHHFSRDFCVPENPLNLGAKEKTEVMTTPTLIRRMNLKFALLERLWGLISSVDRGETDNLNIV